MAKQDHIHDEDLGKYFTIMLNMADDDLDPYQYRLLAHYKRVCGKNGECYQSTRTVAEVCQMSVGKVASVRRELETMGYIRILERGDTTFLITIIDRMKENVERYAKRSQDEHSVHEVNANVHEVKQRITHEEKPIKKLREKRAGKQPVPKEQIDPMKEAILNSFKWTWEGMTEDEMGMVYKSARQLCLAGYTPEDVKGIYAYCVGKGFDGFGPTALTKHATQWRATRPKKPTTQIIPLYDEPPAPQPMPEDVKAAMAEIMQVHRNRMSASYYEDQDNGHKTGAA